MFTWFKILFIPYYIVGNLFLQLDNIVNWQDLSDMYHHCKEMEDKDLNLVEFATDHVSTIFQLLEGTENDSDAGDKPHTPPQKIILAPSVSFNRSELLYSSITPCIIIQQEKRILNIHFHSFDFCTDVFRPPILV